VALLAESGYVNDYKERMSVKFMTFLTNFKIKRLKKRLTVLYRTRQAGSVNDQQLKREVDTYHKLADVYDKHRFNKHFPHAKEMALENHRAAAEMGDSKSQYTVGQRLMDDGRFWMELNDEIYQHDSHKAYATAFFEEAFRYLNTAHEQGNFLATRLMGVAYVNGWGVEMDVDQGAKYLVDSINAEKSWDRVSQIFSDLGLNNPEFFTKFMSMQGKSE